MAGIFGLSRRDVPSLLNPTLDAVHRGCHRHGLCGCPMRLLVFRRHHHYAEDGNPRRRAVAASENTGRPPTAALIGNVVTARGESWPPATRNGPADVGCGRQCWLA